MKTTQSFINRLLNGEIVTPFKPITIDFTTNVYSVKLFSRIVWQQLFNIYRSGNGDLDRMDSLICDLYSLEKLIAEPEGGIIFWSFNGSITNICSFPEPMSYRIEYCYPQVIITRIQ